MAHFQARKAYHFSTDGTEDTTWARFTKVAGSDPVIYEFDTTHPAYVAKLRVLADDGGDYGDIVEVDDKPKRARGSRVKTVAAAADTGGDDGTADTGGDADGEDQSGS